MKWVLNIIAVLVTLAGVIFFLQGTNILPVGGMAGQSQWTIIGAGMAIAGIALLVFLNRRS
jgi:hypothetical protein